MHDACGMPRPTIRTVTKHDETTSAASKLDAELAAVQEALKRGDRVAASVHLRAVDAALSGIANPVVRGLAYANVQAELGKATVAVSVVEDLLEVMGDDAFTYHQLGVYRRQAGDLDGALAALARACEVDPARTEAWLDLGILLDQRALPERSIDCYREALRRAPMDVDVWRNLGNSLAALQRFEEAIAAYETVLAQRPDDRTVLLLRAAAHQAMGDVERANALTPVDLRGSIGAVVQVLDQTEPQAFGCRFRSPPEQHERRVHAASILLQTVRRAQGVPGEDRPAWVLVAQGDLVLVCDRDPRRPDHPNRFFDASELVASTLRAQG
jgi:tetratricopeptide (TPR) repeat protein